MAEAKGEYGEPWSASMSGRSNPRFLVDANGIYLGELDGPAVPYEQDGRNAARVVACVNLMAGVPAARLDPADPAVAMFLAYLRGDETAAVAWADEVSAKVNAGEGYVSRADLEGRCRVLKRFLATLSLVDREPDTQCLTFRVPKEVWHEAVGG